MPLGAFFNLSQAKQDKIIKSAYNEFSKNTYEKASLFLIAQNSQISRASLYCYFKDKEDLYKYLVYNIMKPHIDNVLTQKSNQPFYLAKSLFDYFVSFYKKPEQSFVSTMLKNMNPSTISYFSKDLKNEKICDLILNHKLLNTKSETYIYIISVSILSNMAICLLQYFENIISKKQAIQYFDNTLNILSKSIKGE